MTAADIAAEADIGTEESRGAEDAGNAGGEAAQDRAAQDRAAERGDISIAVRRPSLDNHVWLAERMALARLITREVERLRGALHDESKPLEVRIEVKKQILDAADRLTNLMTLILTHVEEFRLGEAVRERVNEDIALLRNHISHLGTSLILERLAVIREKAEAILDGDGYPLGCVFPLRAELIDLLSTIESLRGDEPLDPEAGELMHQTVDLFNRLLEMERTVALPNFGDSDANAYDPMRPIRGDKLIGQS